MSVRVAASALMLVALGLGATGCVRLTRPLTPPDRGGAPWIAAQTEHFDLTTDLDIDDADQVAVTLERTYAALRAVAFSGAPEAPSRVAVVWFTRPRDYAAIGPEGTGASFTAALPNDVDPTPTLLLSGAPGLDTARAIAHEIAHHFLHRAAGHLPAWLEEGLAEIYGTLEIEGDIATIGGPPTDVRPAAEGGWRSVREGAFEVTLVPRAAIPPASKLLASPSRAFYARRGSGSATEAQAAMYAGAATLVRLLWLHPSYSARFDALVRALARGTPFEIAWPATFGGVDMAALEARFQRALGEMDAGDLVRRFVVRLAPMSSEPAYRSLDSIEVHLLWARLRDWRDPEGQRRAAGDMDTVCTAGQRTPMFGPWCGWWRHIVSDKSREILPTLVGHAPSAAPGSDPLPWMIALRVARDRLAKDPRDPEAEALLIEAGDALIVTARSPVALQLAADHAGMRGRWDEALALAEKSVRADPACAVCAATWAEVLYVKDRPQEALEAVRRALRFVPEDDTIAGEALKAAEKKYEAAWASARSSGAAEPP